MLFFTADFHAPGLRHIAVRGDSEVARWPKSSSAAVETPAKGGKRALTAENVDQRDAILL
jgi:hypothetical protein